MTIWRFEEEMTMDDQSKAEGAFAKALAAAQAEIGPCAQSGRVIVARDREPRPYATLNDVWEACRGPLTRHGFAVMHFPHAGRDEEGGSVVTVRTVLMHESGSVENKITIPAQRTPQGIGSAITYAKRYNLTAMTGVTPRDDDDDGEAASEGMSQATGAEAESVRAQPRGQRDITRELYAAYKRACREAGHEALSIARVATHTMGLDTFDSESLTDDQWASLGALIREMTKDVAAAAKRSSLSSRIPTKAREPGDDDPDEVGR